MTREEKIELLNRLLEIEEKNDIGNLTSTDRREFQQWVEELEQEPSLDKIRAEIAEYGSIRVSYAITKDTKTDKGIEKLVSDVLKRAKEQVLDIIDKYKESEDKE